MGLSQFRPFWESKMPMERQQALSRDRSCTYGRIETLMHLLAGKKCRMFNAAGFAGLVIVVSGS